MAPLAPTTGVDELKLNKTVTKPDPTPVTKKNLRNSLFPQYFSNSEPNIQSTNILIKTCQIPPWKKRYVNGCHSISSPKVLLGTIPKIGKSLSSMPEKYCKMKIKKLIEIISLIASVKRDGRREL
ncbi:MAG: hypothetical protein QF712_02015 [Candidatus Marinimicrobia bacterium]|jgi:hypothetical protein|nr:hypothetical protein [Candidatus Neomarinimicrobiota bacterium]|tara:strand:- start:3530 stop:3904 length:375 start_codon:yes stop_codon:yes gene_type:complete